MPKVFMRGALLFSGKAGSFLIMHPEEPASFRSRVMLLPETGEVRPAPKQGYVEGAIGGSRVWSVDKFVELQPR